MRNPSSLHTSVLRLPQSDTVTTAPTSKTLAFIFRERSQLAGLVLVLLGCAVLLGTSIHGLKGNTDWNFSDFKCVYSGARCMILGCNPYDEDVLIRTYTAAGGDPDKWFPLRQYNANYLPPALALTVPFAALPWEPAKDLWILLSLLAFLIAAVMAWDLARPYAPIVAGLLMGLFVGGSSMLLRTANPAGLAIGLSVIAVWCFLRERFTGIGVACLALGLTLKPHDVWLIWVWLFLGSSLRRLRALQVVGLFLAISIPALLWFSLTPASAHWAHDLRANLAGNVSRGFADDPGPANSWSFSLTNLQAIVAVFADDPHVYNPAAYLVSGLIFLAWAYLTVKRAPSRSKDLLALACIAAISLLPLYHRQYDTRLLLMVFPATAVAWAGGGLLSWLALLMAGAGILFCSTRTMVGLSELPVSAPGVYGKLQTMLFHRSMALVILVLCAFHLILYLRVAKRNQPHAV